MDDIVIFSKDFKSHIEILEDVFKRLRLANVSLKLSKCMFVKKTVDFLGYELSQKGVKPQAKLTHAIRDFATPQSKKEVKRFLGMAGFYRNFIQNFADVSKPLCNLTRDNVNFIWDEKCDSAFNSLKLLLCSEPVLAFPRCGETFVVEVDASDLAIGGELSQKDTDGILHPVAYFSTLLKGPQRNWSTHSKEAFALLMAVRH